MSLSKSEWIVGHHSLPLAAMEKSVAGIRYSRLFTSPIFTR